jgi:hypothetical protein
MQHWQLDDQGYLRQRDKCLGSEDGRKIKEAACLSWRNKDGGRWSKKGSKVPIERKLYDQARSEHPESFALLEKELQELDALGTGPQACQEGACYTLEFADGSGRCVGDDGTLIDDKSMCAVVLVDGGHIKKADGGECLDSASDESMETWVWYGCHDGVNQKFSKEGPVRICAVAQEHACFRMDKNHR